MTISAFLVKDKVLNHIDEKIDHLPCETVFDKYVRMQLQSVYNDIEQGYFDWAGESE